MYVDNPCKNMLWIFTQILTDLLLSILNYLQKVNWLLLNTAAQKRFVDKNNNNYGLMKQMQGHIYGYSENPGK